MARLSTRQREFVAKAYAAAREAGLTGVQADLAVSQAIHESAWGSSPSGTNNVHGIKGKGSSVATHEIVNGKRVNVRANFRNFSSLTDSFRHWKGLMERRFSAVMNADTLGEAVKALRAGKQGGYATDPNYDRKIKQTAKLVKSSPVGLAASLPKTIDAPSFMPLTARLAQAPIPSNLPSPFRPDNLMAGGPVFPRQILTAATSMPARPITPTPPAASRFGGNSRSDFVPPAPVMGSLGIDPARFGRLALGPSSTPARPLPHPVSRPVPQSNSAPIPARFGPAPAPRPQAPQMASGGLDPARLGRVAMAPRAPLPQPIATRYAPVPQVTAPPRPAPVNAVAQATMAPPNVPDPARLGQIAMGPTTAPVDRSVVPSNPGQLGGITMSNPVGLGGPGGLMLPLTAAVPPTAPVAAAPAPVAPPPVKIAPPLAPPRMIQQLPVHAVESGFPTAPPPPPAYTPMDVYRGMADTAMSASGNRVSRDIYGNIGITNKYGATTIQTPNGQGFGSLGPLASGSQIEGPLSTGGMLAEPKEEGTGFGDRAKSGLLGGLGGALFGGLPGALVGGLAGLTKPELEKARTAIGNVIGRATGGLLGNGPFATNQQILAAGGSMATVPMYGGGTYTGAFPAAPSLSPLTAAQRALIDRSRSIDYSGSSQAQAARSSPGLY